MRCSIKILAMNDLLKRLKTEFTLDKQTHFFASGWLFFMFMVVYDSYDFAILSTVMLFTGKEFYDFYFKGTGFSVGDMFFNLAGLCISLLIFDVQKTHQIWNWLQILLG